MKYRLRLSLVVCCLGTCSLTAQDCPFPKAEEIFHGNAIRTIVSNTGNLFQSSGLEAQFQVPFTGPETPHMLFAGGLWLGGYDDDANLKVAAQTFKYALNLEYTPGPLNSAGSTDPVICDLWDQIWMVTRNDILMHIADYADDGQIDNPIASVLGWPGRDNPEFESYHEFPLSNAPGFGAPFADLNDNGIYEPQLGEYPHPENVGHEVIPMSIAWTVFSDSPNLHRVTNGDPLQAEVQLTMYAFSCDGTRMLNEMLFVSYKVANRSTGVLDSLVLGQWLDPDLGCHVDDFFGSYPQGNSFFIYNEDAVDGFPEDNCTGGALNTYGAYPPALSVTFLNRNLSSFTYYKNSAFNDTEPGTSDPRIGSPIEFYRYMTGHWRDGTPLTVGGDGYAALPGDVTQYAFPGDPADPESWAMTNIDPGLHDHRIIGSVALPDLDPGEHVTIDMAFAFHRDSSLSNTGNVTLMYDQVDTLQAMYNSGFISQCTFSNMPCVVDCVHPGDTDADGKVGLKDYLNTALGQHTSGPQRPGPVAFNPLTADPWGQSTNDGVNYKHLDCDGDGDIETSDFGLIDLYYGMQTIWHLPKITVAAGDDITIVPVNPDLIVGTDFYRTDIRWDSPDVDSLYGLAFAFEYDTAVFDGVIPAGIARLFDGEQTLFRQYTQPGRIEYILAAHDLRNKPVQPSVLMKPNLLVRNDITVSDAIDTTILSIVDIKAVLRDGTILDVGSQDVPVKIMEEISSTTEVTGNGFRVYPNPSTGLVQVDKPGTELYANLSVFAADGRHILDRTIANTTAFSLPPGVYYVVVRGEVICTRKVIVLR